MAFRDIVSCTKSAVNCCNSAWTLRTKRPTGMPALALMYPCLTLANLGDPLDFAIASGEPVTPDSVRRQVNGSQAEPPPSRRPIIRRRVLQISAGTGLPSRFWTGIRERKC